MHRSRLYLFQDVKMFLKNAFNKGNCSESEITPSHWQIGGFFGFSLTKVIVEWLKNVKIVFFWPVSPCGSLGLL